MTTYILKDKVPVAASEGVYLDRSKEENWVVKKTEIDKAVVVSTVFLGIDHSIFGGAAPLLFETMIFGGPLNEYLTRCATWEEAETMHEKACLRALMGVEGDEFEN